MGIGFQLLQEANFDDRFRQEAQMNGSRYDTHTGLLNYESFQERLKTLLREWPAGSEVALVWVDLLNLRRAFSLRGWTGAEALVRRVAAALRATVDEHALLGRFSGRCFVIAMPSVKLDRRERRRIQALVDAMKSAQLLESEIEPEVAAGVAFYPSDTTSAEDLVRFASLAATRAGYLKSPTVMTFHAAMNSLIMRDYQLETEMQRGLDNGQFRTVYQPKLDLMDGRVLGAEALIRWHHPEWGAVPPSEFIPVAERSGLIHRIFELTMRNALRDAQLWRGHGFRLPIISVNVSAANMRRADFVGGVRRALRETPIEPTRLELEVTESVLFDDEELFASKVKHLKEIGARVAIDDFGTRYTGFNVLRRVPLDAMKIDKCFIEGIDQSKDMQTMCQTIVTMARQLRMRTVAEGIETQAELDALRRIGCEAGQGYLFQRPVDEGEFSRFLCNWPRRMQEFGFAELSHALEMTTLHGIA